MDGCLVTGRSYRLETLVDCLQKQMEGMRWTFFLSWVRMGEITREKASSGVDERSSGAKARAEWAVRATVSTEFSISDIWSDIGIWKLRIRRRRIRSIVWKIPLGNDV